MIELHHYTSNIFEIGVMEKIIDGFKVKVYDVNSSLKIRQA